MCAVVLLVGARLVTLFLGGGPELSCCVVCQPRLTSPGSFSRLLMLTCVSTNLREVCGRRLAILAWWWWSSSLDLLCTTSTFTHRVTVRTAVWHWQQHCHTGLTHIYHIQWGYMTMSSLAMSHPWARFLARPSLLPSHAMAAGYRGPPPPPPLTAPRPDLDHGWPPFMWLGSSVHSHFAGMYMC